MAKNLLNELPVNFPKKELKTIFESYPTLNLHAPSSWILWSGEKIKAYNKQVCHAAMRHEKPGWDNLITAVPKSDELSLEYLRMLIRGPFRSMADLIKLERLKDNYYLHCMSLDKWPSNVLFNFCIASRVPIEFEFLLKPWAKRCETGFDSTLAFLLTYSYGDEQNSRGPRNFSIKRSGHMWIDPASSWENILCGEMADLSGTFNTNPSKCIPTNSIWGLSSDYKKLINMSDEQVAEFYSVPIRVIEPPPAPKAKALKVNFANYAIQQLQAQQALQAHVAEDQPVEWGQPMPNGPDGAPLWVFDPEGNLQAVDQPEQVNVVVDDDDIFPDQADDFDHDEDDF